MYCGIGGFLKKGTPDEVATQTAVYTRKGCERCIRWAFDFTRKRNNPKKMLTLVAKTNVLTFGHDLWWRTFQDVAKEYPDIKTDYNHVDACCMWMVKNPEYYDVIVTTNMFGDIITDLAGILQGGMGVAAGGNINPEPGGTSMFEPMGGSAPKYTGTERDQPHRRHQRHGACCWSTRGQPAAAPRVMQGHPDRHRHEDEEPGRRQDGLQHAAGRRSGVRGAVGGLFGIAFQALWVAVPIRGGEIEIARDWIRMISLVEALGFRCLRYVSQPLGPFHVLVGPNGSGKTTFLDVVGFLGDLVSEGLDAAVGGRTQNFEDLVWEHGNRFELAIEARIPEVRRGLLSNPKYDTIRYEVAIEIDAKSGETTIAAERGLLIVSRPTNHAQKSLFPLPEAPPATLLAEKTPNSRRLFSKTPGGNDNYYADAQERAGMWAPAFKLGPRKSTLGNLPEDESNFPVSTWFKQLLSDGVERIVLNSLHIRRASPPGQGSGFRPDGSNLPWVLADLQDKTPQKVVEWLDHVRTAIPDLQSVRTVVREDDRHRYMVLVYAGGLEVPSWMASDGTLRLLALTLPAYLDKLKGIYLIEEPENGIHPCAVETMYQSLNSVYDAQILLATHSPVILSVAESKDVLCFAKNDEGAADIVLGSEHPKLRDWHGEVNLGTLFASGVLG